MIEDFILKHIWIGTLAAALLFIVSHALMVWEIQLYNRGGKDLVSIEGYDRLVANYLKPDGSIRWLHLRLIGILLVICIGLPSAWWALTGKMALPQVYLLLLGGICIYACMDITEELRMIAFWRYGMKEYVSGELKVSRRLVRTLAYIIFYGYALLFLILSVVTGSWFILGGLFASFVMAQQQRDVALIKP